MSSRTSVAATPSPIFSAGLVALPIAWHPVTPLFHARIGQTREILCDALAARAVGSHTAYARSLLTLARDIQAATQPNSTTLALFSAKPKPSLLEERIMKLIAPPSSVPTNRMARITLGIVLTALATCTAAALHLQAVSATRRVEPAATHIPTDPRTSTTITTRQFSNPPATSHHQWMASAYTVPGNAAISQAAAPVHHDVPAPTPATAPASMLPPLPAPAPPSPFAKPATPNQPAPPETQTPLPPMSPAERGNLDKLIAAAEQQMSRVLSQKLFDEKALSAQSKALNSGEMQLQIADAQKQINSPEFQKQIAQAGKLAAEHALTSQEFHRQMDQAMRQVKIAQADLANQKLDIHIDKVRIQQQLKTDSEAMANARIHIHIDTIHIQKQLEAVRKQLEEARRNNQQP